MFYILLAVLIVAIVLFYKIKFSYWKSRNVKFDSPSIPFGNLFGVIKGETSVGHKLADLYFKYNEPFYGFYSLWMPILVIKDPEICKTILIKDFDSFRNRPFAVDETADSIASNLVFALRDTQWKNLRAKLSPIFTSGKLKLMFPLIKQCITDFENYLIDHNERSHEMKDACAKFTTDTIVSCAFGIKANSFQSENAEFRVAGRKLFDFNFSRAMQNTAYFFAPMLVYIFKLKFIDPSAAEFLRRIFWKTIEDRENGKVPVRNDLIDILISLKNEDTTLLKGDILPAQAITFFAAGHETTSSAISYTLHELCIHQDIQEKLRQEVLKNVEEHGDITYESLNEMKYLSMVVSETLRKYPFAPFLSRQATQDYKMPEHDLVIQKGTQVFFPLFGFHYDERYFPEPEKYDPERFNDQNKQKIPPFTYMPFGEGPRACIGERFGLLTTKLAIAYLVKNFHFIKGDNTLEKLIFNPRAPLLTAKNGVPVYVRKRE